MENEFNSFCYGFGCPRSQIRMLDGDSDYHIASSTPCPLYRLTVGLKWLYPPNLLTPAARCALCKDTGFSHFSTERVSLCEFCPGQATFAERYQIIRLLAEGAFSRVFLVRDRYTRDARVIKLLHSGLEVLAESEMTMLQLLARLDGGRMGLQHFHEVIRHEGQVGLVLEYLQPITRSKLKLGEVRRLIVDVALVLYYMHHTQNVHADVKADNIMYQPSDERFRLIDFGNCVPLDQLDSYFEQFEIQSMAYRAPEVLVGLLFSVEIDIWSLGVVVLQLLMGALPFIGDRGEMLNQIAQVIGPYPDHFSKGVLLETELPMLSAYNHSSSFWRHWRRNNLARLLNVKDRLLLELLAGMLDCDPKQRFSAAQVLSHPFLAPLVPFPPSF